MIWLAKIVALMLNTGLVKRMLRAQVSHGTSCCTPLTCLKAEVGSVPL